MAKPSSGLNRSAPTSISLSKARSEERTMPHVIVKLWPGKSEQQKRSGFSSSRAFARC